MVQVVSLNVEKHAVKMMEELHQMKQENDYCDFIIQVGDDVYHTHKNILSAGSEYFRAMLKHDTKESREGRTVLKDVDSECVKNCIDVIYSGKFEIPDEKMNDLLHVAIMMQLTEVKQAISDILAESITVDNYFSTKHVADMYGLDDVCSKCRTFFQEHVMDISNDGKFGNIEKNDILAVLNSEKSTLCEEEKVTLSLKWVEYNHEKKKYLHECFNIIEFHKIPPAFLQDLLKAHPIICNDFALYKLITGHLIETLEGPNETKDEFIVLFDSRAHCLRSFNPISGKVEKFTDETFSQFKTFSTISLDSYIYVLSKNKSMHRLNFRRKNSRWEKMENLIGDHGDAPRSVTLSGAIFVIGGGDVTATDLVERFEPPLNQWFLLKNKPKAIAMASFVSLNDFIYCIGGWCDGKAVSSFCSYTPSTSEWVDLEPMRYAVCASCVVAVEQRIFVIGGWNGEKVKNVECYDVTSAQWTSLSSTNATHSWDDAHHVGNWIYAVGNLETSDDIEKYDVLNNKWHKLNPKGVGSFGIYASAIVKL